MRKYKKAVIVSLAGALVLGAPVSVKIFGNDKGLGTLFGVQSYAKDNRFENEADFGDFHVWYNSSEFSGKPGILFFEEPRSLTIQIFVKNVKISMKKGVKETSDTIYAIEGFNGNIEIEDLRIKKESAEKRSGINLSHTRTNLILTGKNIIEMKSSKEDYGFACTAVGVLGSNSLLKISGLGTLVAIGTTGIGATDYNLGNESLENDPGNILIESGRILARSNAYYGAGIGGGAPYRGRNAGRIKITEGTITALGGKLGGAGIGGGYQGSVELIEIIGGNIYAEGSRGMDGKTRILTGDVGAGIGTGGGNMNSDFTDTKKKNKNIWRYNHCCRS